MTRPGFVEQCARPEGDPARGAEQQAAPSAIDGRTTRHPGYVISQQKRKRVEEIFGWIKTVGSVAQDPTSRPGTGGVDVHLRGGGLQSGPHAESGIGASLRPLRGVVCLNGSFGPSADRIEPVMHVVIDHRELSDQSPTMKSLVELTFSAARNIPASFGLLVNAAFELEPRHEKAVHENIAALMRVAPTTQGLFSATLPFREDQAVIPLAPP